MLILLNVFLMDILEWFVGGTYKFEQVSCASKMSFPDPCAFHARSYYSEQLVQACTPSPQSFEYAPPLCDSCQSFDHDINSCLHVIFMDSRLNQLEQDRKNYRESMENMTSTLIDQFSELVIVM